MEKLKQIHPDSDAFTFTFEDDLLNEIRESFNQELKPFIINKRNEYLFALNNAEKFTESRNSEYFLLHFDYYPTVWVSNNTNSTFQIFQQFFEGLGIENDLKELIDYQNKIIMYSGFFVIGNQSPVELWHIDYSTNANAYTMITPLYELEPEHGNLLYKPDKEVLTYKYKRNEAILVGEDFLHTTEPYEECKKIRVLVSLTFGTDKLKYWPKLKSYMKTQSKYFMLPCGHINGSCKCLRWQPFKRIAGLFR